MAQGLPVTFTGRSRRWWIQSMITLTTSAVAAVKAAMSRSAEAEGLRVVAEAGGSAAVRYMMHLETGARDGDVVIEQWGLKVFIDGPSQVLAHGIRIDFVASAAGGFVFENQPALPALAGGCLAN